MTDRERRTPDAWDDEPTPAIPHARPVPPRPTPSGGFLAPLGRAAPGIPPDPEFARLARNWVALDADDRRLVQALALRLRQTRDAAGR